MKKTEIPSKPKGTHAAYWILAKSNQMDSALVDPDFKVRHKKRALPNYGFARFVIDSCLNQET
ncbi:hypothetical protein [Streptococcus merionis]|uniref:hypothetical protein n=1 Tax=Streptococcus merionis TaxID=400065 RepID=UPI0026ECBC99|nr:hypothetical protein [Streptococcus merionis]